MVFNIDNAIEKSKKQKPLFDDNMKCPHCTKMIHIKIEKETITPAIPAETTINAFIEKSEQTTL